MASSTRVPSEEDWKKLSKLIDQFYNRPDAGNKEYIYILYYNHYEGWRCFVLFFVLVDCGKGGGELRCVLVQTYFIGCVCVLSKRSSHLFSFHIYFGLLLLEEPFRAPVEWKTLGK